MNRPPHDDLPPRCFPAHWVVAILALVGAVAVQANWAGVLHGPAASALWPYSAAALLAATAWLLSTAWLHWRLAEWRPPEWRGRLRRLGALAVSESIVAAFAGVLLWQGHGSRVLLAGLWTVPPVLLAASVISLAAIVASAGSTWREVRDQQPEESDVRPPSDRWRTAIVLALLIALGLLASQPLPAKTQSSTFKVGMNSNFEL